MKANLYASGYTEKSGSDLAGFLKRTFTAEETEQADMLIAAVEREIATRCKRQFLFQSKDDEGTVIDQVYEEYFDLPESVFFTHNFPIKAVSKIILNGAEQTMTANTDYFVYDDHIEFYPTLLAGIQGRRALKIEYTIEKFWGEEIDLLVLKLAGRLWLSAENAGVGVRETSFASMREAMDTQGFKTDTDRIVSLYRKRLI